MKKWLLMIPTLLALGCGGKHSTPKPDPKLPAKVLLTVPAQNSVCTTGEYITGTSNKVAFTWNSAANTNKYTINLRNLVTQESTEITTTETHLDIILKADYPYAWYIVSRTLTTNDTAKSDVWKFYDAQNSTGSYPPMPAQLTLPTFGQSIAAVAGKIDLAWIGGT